jgi:hypothetical protein
MSCSAQTQALGDQSAFSFCLLLKSPLSYLCFLVGADEPQVFLYLKRSECEVSKQFR